MTRARVVTCSTRAAAGEYDDTSGPLLVDALRDWGFDVNAPVVVADGEPVRDALTAAVREGVAVVITTGGTGVSPTDHTPEITAELLDRELPGVPEAIRARGIAAGVAQAALSRGLAGVSGATFVVNLPGSVGGVRDALPVLEPIVWHVVDQIAGGDHPR